MEISYNTLQWFYRVTICIWLFTITFRKLSKCRYIWIYFIFVLPDFTYKQSINSRNIVSFRFLFGCFMKCHNLDDIPLCNFNFFFIEYATEHMWTIKWFFQLFVENDLLKKIISTERKFNKKIMKIGDPGTEKPKYDWIHPTISYKIRKQYVCLHWVFATKTR